MKKTLHTLTLFTGLVLAASLCFAAEPYKKPQVGDTAHDFTLKSSTGENIRLHELRGQYVLINFWSSWSGTSRRLLNQFETLYQAQKPNDVEVLSINIDPEKSQNLIKRLDVEHTVLLDENRYASRTYMISNIPSIYLLDRSGKLMLILEGYDPLYYQVTENKLQQALTAETSSSQ